MSTYEVDKQPKVDACVEHIKEVAAFAMTANNISVRVALDGIRIDNFDSYRSNKEAAEVSVGPEAVPAEQITQPVTPREDPWVNSRFKPGVRMP